MSVKQIFIGSVLLATAASAAIKVGSDEAAFESFVTTYNKKYVTDAEAAKRKAIFMSNMRKAAIMQEANPLAVFGPTKFSDLTSEEFRAYHNGAAHFKRAVEAKQNAAPALRNLFTKVTDKAAVDWREKKAVTPVKDQGECGSCWAFSAVGGIEGAWAVAKDKLVPLSEQNLVACDSVDQGCNGGLMDDAFKWLIDNKGGSIATEASYPYTAGSGTAGTCKHDGIEIGATITGYKDLPTDEAQIGEYVLKNGPACVAVDATSFQFYSSGILTSCISYQLDHGVLAVGFSDDNVPPYWIIKNSWGSNWGEQGYIRIQKGSNQCLIRELVSVPLV